MATLAHTKNQGCLGVHLARLELRLATAKFFIECLTTRLAASTTPDSTEMQDHSSSGDAGRELPLHYLENAS
jgi:hypothetical protein